MKKLTLYSVYNSTHTQSLFSHLSETWDTNLLIPSNEKQLAKDIIEIYKSVNSNVQIKTDHEYIKSVSKFLFQTPLSSFTDIIKSKNQFKKLTFLRRRAESVATTLSNLETDLLYTHQIDLGLIAYLSKFKPYVMTFWGSDLYRDVPQFKDKTLIKNALDSAALIHVVNQEQKNILIRDFTVSEEKIFVQHFGADIDRFQLNKNKEIIKKNFGFKEKFIILSARYSLDPNLFRLDLIARAFKTLLDKHPQLNARLVFINRANKDLELLELIKNLKLEDKVSFLGLLEGSQYEEIVKISDVFVQCPQYDSVGVALMEALAAGVPIITTPVTGALINVKDGYNGFFIEKRDSELLADNLSKILLDDQLRKKLSSNAYNWAVNNCSRKSAMLAINQKLKQILNY